MGKEYPDAIDMFVDKSRVFIDAKPRGAIVIHKTASKNKGETTQNTATYFATTPEKTSSHFVIGRDGAVVQCVSLNDGAAANCCRVGDYPKGNIHLQLRDDIDSYDAGSSAL